MWKYSSYFCATFSPVRKSEIIERKFKTQNPNPSPSGSDSEPASPARNQIEAKRLRNKKGRVERNLSFAENDQVWFFFEGLGDSGDPGGSRRPGRSGRSGSHGFVLGGQGGQGDSGRPGRCQEAKEVRETRDVPGGQGGPGGLRGKLHIIMAAFEDFCPKNSWDKSPI